MKKSATETLRNDHKQIRRLEKIITQCYTKLYDGKDIPFSDIEQITIIMSEFLDAIHYSREEDAYFACVASYDTLKNEIRTFLIEHEFARRIAKSVSDHLYSWKKGNNEREPVARFLKTYAVYLDEHITKEENFFDKAEREVLSQEEEMMMYEEFRAVTAVTTKLEKMLNSISFLEQRPWMKD
jgi:hemerythrin-like domain-containing protein